MSDAQRASIVWFRQDLRLSDNRALFAACKRAAPIIPLYVWDEASEDGWKIGAASRWWLHQSLRSLDESLKKLGTALIIRPGNSTQILVDLARETGASHVYWNRRYEAHAVRQEALMVEALEDAGIEVEISNSSLLYLPEQVSNREGKPFRVFTSFWKKCAEMGEPMAPLPQVKRLSPLPNVLDTLPLKALDLEPKLNWSSGLRKQWQPGEGAGQRQLKGFVAEALSDYTNGRDRPDREGVSRMSPYLHFGEISSRQVWHAVRTAAGRNYAMQESANTYCKELGWREFAHHVLYHYPETADKPLQKHFEKFRWIRDESLLKRWQQGQTGYPMVDAGMRQLWATGWMHNRVRMIVASFLTKHLLISWRQGAAWFWDTLVDADLANNTLGWQWAGGCGADAAPYFRIFNPVLQGQKFDPEGNYVRAWIPELQKVPARWIHRPWQAPATVLQEAGVELGRDYPQPIVDHNAARLRALTAFAEIAGNKK